MALDLQIYMCISSCYKPLIFLDKSKILTHEIPASIFIQEVVEENSARISSTFKWEHWLGRR